MTQSLFSRRLLLSATGIALSLQGLPLPALAGNKHITVKGFDAQARRIDVAVPLDPHRLAVNDISVMDTLQQWDLLDRVVIGADTKSLHYLPALPTTLKTFEKGLKDPQLEEIAAQKPDLTFISARLARFQAEFAKLGPVLNLAPNYAYGALKSYEGNLLSLGAIFEKTDLAEAAIADTRKRVGAIASIAKGRSCAVLMLTGGRMNILAPKGRCALISDELGFTNVEPPRTSTAPKKRAPGPKPTADQLREMNDKTIAKIKALDPEYIFVLNKDLAVSVSRPVSLETILAGNADMPNGKRIVQLTHSAWYLGEGGIKSMDVMLKDIEDALEL